MSVDWYSYPVLFLEVLSGTDKVISEGATGLLIKADEKLFLVTNWHVVTGAHPETRIQKSEAVPEKLRIHYRQREFPHFSDNVRTEIRVERLRDSEFNPRWFECPATEGPFQMADVVLLPLESVPDPGLALEWHDSTPFHLPVTTPLSIIGYPYGARGYAQFPLWLNGTVASDMAGTFGRKYFFIDARTRPASSGSLVVHRSIGAVGHGVGIGLQQTVTIVCGIYSGRLDESSDVGIVWQPSVVENLVWKALPERPRPGEKQNPTD